MRTCFATGCFIVGFLLTAQAPIHAGEDLEKTRAVIEKINDTLVKASIEGDIDTIMSYYLDDVIYMPSYAPMIKGKEGIRKREEEAKEKGHAVNSMNVTILDLCVSENIVCEIGLYGISMIMPGRSRPVADKGKYLTVWERQADGALKIKAEIWNSDINPWVEDK